MEAEIKKSEIYTEGENELVATTILIKGIPLKKYENIKLRINDFVNDLNGQMKLEG